MRVRSLIIAALLLLVAPALLTIVVPDADTLGVSVAYAKKKAKKKAEKKKKKKKKGKGKAAEAPPPPPDGDGDGIIDADDKCPEQAEDQDAFEDEDGCPDLDNDGDGINDDEDQCPDEAESMDGWSDEDGCPETPPKIAPMTLDAELNDGTKIKGTIIRITAVDEDEPDSENEEPTDFECAVGDAELVADWSKVTSLSAEKVNFSDAVDCYSEGVQNLGDPTTWECTLKNPTKIGLSESTTKGTHRYLDRKMKRLDLQIDGLECSGEGCARIEESKTLSVYLYKLITITQNDDEAAAVTELQVKLRELQKQQIKKAKLSLVTAE